MRTSRAIDRKDGSKKNGSAAEPAILPDRPVQAAGAVPPV
ncbi:hypothetical protein B8V81_4256 [Paenibacillus pasadenensis]|uniref:Uncharacterized protein n=1 Tax=Paenibacillus pasadenensis TaxID=217090 RepID=A0A2N5N671_9BACL|nr:hypothetical protein B8V81_4256 [Paenibacillus pasadenensis]